MLIYLELSSICQLKCPFCRTGGQKHNYPQVPRGLMTKETFGNAMKKIPDIHYIYFYNWGEPLLNPEVAWFCSEAVNTFHVRCEIGSNMQRLNEEMAEDIVKSGIQSISISCNGASQETYEKYNIGGSLDKLISNTKLLIEKKNQLNSKTPHIIVKMNVNKFNEHEIPIFEAFARGFGAETVDISGLCAMTPQGSEMFEEFQPSDKKYDGRTRGKLLTCSAPTDRVAIDWDGEVYPCCNPSGLHAYSCGNINTQSFKDIWNGPKFEYIRRFCVKGNAEQNDFVIPCYSCFGKYPSEELKTKDLYSKFIK